MLQPPHRLPLLQAPAPAPPNPAASRLPPPAWRRSIRASRPRFPRSLQYLSPYSSARLHWYWIGVEWKWRSIQTGIDSISWNA
ncbi:hypothetical protein EJB05_43887, partial [Eragrostis curvula]